MATLQESKARITSRVWQSIAQSGVDVSSIPQEQLSVLVGAIADGMLLAMDEMLGDIGAAQRTFDTGAAVADGSDEAVLWEGRPLLSLIESYVVTNQRVRVIRGLLGKDREDIELVRIQDIDHKQTLGERILNIGDVYIRSSNASDPEVTLRNVTDPDKVHEVIRRAMMDARKRYRLTFQEEM